MYPDHTIDELIAIAHDPYARTELRKRINEGHKIVARLRGMGFDVTATMTTIRKAEAALIAYATRG